MLALMGTVKGLDWVLRVLAVAVQVAIVVRARDRVVQLVIPRHSAVAALVLRVVFKRVLIPRLFVQALLDLIIPRSYSS